MMSTNRSWVALFVVATLLATTSVSSGQEYDDPNAATSQMRDWASDETAFLFTPTILKLATHRFADELARHYDLDPVQHETTRILLEHRFPRWFMENREDVIRLTNQYVEAVLGDEPPTPEQVAEWAEQAKPLMDEFANEVRTTTDDMRDYLDEEQRIKLDQERAAFEVAMGYMERRMQAWVEGGYDPITEFPGSPEFQNEERQRRRQLFAEQQAARQEVIRDLEAGLAPGQAGGAPDTVAHGPRGGATGTQDEWAAYVESFIKRYNLTESQQNSAYGVLVRYQSLRDVYLQRKLEQLKELQRLLANATADEDRAKVKKRYDALNEPVDRYFARLKQQLEKLPTRRQRELAEPARTDADARTQANSDKAAAAVE